MNCFSISFNWKGKSSCRKILHHLEHSTPTYKSFGGHIEAIRDATTAVCATKLQEACKSCKVWSKSDTESLEYKQWKMRQEAECSANFSNSSKAMEAAGAIHLWKQFIEKNDLRYTSFVGDGDGASHKFVVDAKPYGEASQIGRKTVLDMYRKELAVDF